MKNIQSWTIIILGITGVCIASLAGAPQVFASSDATLSYRAEASTTTPIVIIATSSEPFILKYSSLHANANNAQVIYCQSTGVDRVVVDKFASLRDYDQPLELYFPGGTSCYAVGGASFSEYYLLIASTSEVMEQLVVYSPGFDLWAAILLFFISAFFIIWVMRK